MGRRPIPRAMRAPRLRWGSGAHRPASDGGAEAQALLVPLARRLYQLDGEGHPLPGAWPAVARLLGLGATGSAQLGYLWRGDRPLTSLWRGRLSPAPERSAVPEVGVVPPESVDPS